MQIKITIRYYYIHTWMGKMKNTDNTKRWPDEEKVDHTCIPGENVK